ncbi:MAG: response regulator, partial [Pseudomonadota bacterium]
VGGHAFFRCVCVEQRQSDPIRKLGQLNFDVVFVDHYLPDGVGLSLLDTHASEKSMTAYIMVTGASDATVDSNALEAGADAFVDKEDVRAETIRRAVRYAIQHKKLLHSLHIARHNAETIRYHQTDIIRSFLADSRRLLQTALRAVEAIDNDLKSDARKLHSNSAKQSLTLLSEFLEQQYASQSKLSIDSKYLDSISSDIKEQKKAGMI